MPRSHHPSPSHLSVLSIPPFALPVPIEQLPRLEENDSLTFLIGVSLPRLFKLSFPSHPPRPETAVWAPNLCIINGWPSPSAGL
jgi:hypothetical protein